MRLIRVVCGEVIDGWLEGWHGSCIGFWNCWEWECVSFPGAIKPCSYIAEESVSNGCVGFSVMVICVIGGKVTS